MLDNFHWYLMGSATVGSRPGLYLVAETNGIHLFHATAHPHSKRVVMGRPCNRSWEIISISTLDATSAFLYADLLDDVTLQANVLEGHPQFEKRTSHCLKIQKNIYGLKEGPLLWWKYLKTILSSFGLKQAIHEVCLFYAKDVLSLVYVDDMLLLAGTVMIKSLGSEDC